MKPGKPLRRKAHLNRRPPTRSKHTPSKPRRRPDPDPGFWRAQREALYARAHGRCERCGCSLDDHGLEAHHRKLRSQGGGHDLANLAALDPTCHTWAHGHPIEARAGGWIVASGGNPETRAVVLHDGRTVRLTTEATYDVCWDDSEEESA